MYMLIVLSSFNGLYVLFGEGVFLESDEYVWVDARTVFALTFVTGATEV